MSRFSNNSAWLRLRGRRPPRSTRSGKTCKPGWRPRSTRKSRRDRRSRSCDYPVYGNTGDHLIMLGTDCWAACQAPRRGTMARRQFPFSRLLRGDDHRLPGRRQRGGSLPASTASRAGDCSLSQASDRDSPPDHLLSRARSGCGSRPSGCGVTPICICWSAIVAVWPSRRRSFRPAGRPWRPTWPLSSTRSTGNWSASSRRPPGGKSSACAGATWSRPTWPRCRGWTTFDASTGTTSLPCIAITSGA